MDFSQIFHNNQIWAEEKLSHDPLFFKHLARGQNPQLLYIGCSDSRVAAEELMGVNPGELFVHRNIANLVVGTDNNLNAVVQYAVEVLRVKHIIVCGHYECGGVKAALNLNDMGQLNSWLQSLRDVYRLHRQELDAIDDQEKRYDRLVELNVIEQCLNLAKIDHVQRQWVKTGFPTIHGWVFNVRDGRLVDLKIRVEEEFQKLLKIFSLFPTRE